MNTELPMTVSKRSANLATAEVLPIPPAIPALSVPHVSAQIVCAIAAAAVIAADF